MKKVSIIIPIYNCEKYLKRCLESIINQTYENIEIICINDGSKDNSLKILKEYKEKDNRIVIIDKENAGVSCARNDGIIKSTGEYITFVDADDWLELDAVEALYNALVEKNVDVVRANYYKNIEVQKNESIGNLYDVANKVYTANEDTFPTIIDRLLTGKISCYLWLLLVKREYVLKTELFKKDVQLMEDTIFYVELFSKINSVYFLDKPTYHYYSNESSCTRSAEYYIRNMYNVVRVNSYIKNILVANNLSEENRLKLMDTVHTNMIINYMFIMFKSGMKRENIIEELDKLLANKDALIIFENANIKELPIHLSIPVKLIIKNKYNTLFNFYKLRNVMSKIKDFVLRRKE